MRRLCLSLYLQRAAVLRFIAINLAYFPIIATVDRFVLKFNCVKRRPNLTMNRIITTNLKRLTCIDINTQ